MTVITRFAPSPTGYLHVGNVRTALVSFAVAHKAGGKFMLRLDDTDLERSSDVYENAIYQDMKWLGLHWDFTAKQSSRIARYEEVKNILMAKGRIYACYDTPDELDMKRKILLSRGRPPIYDREGLNLTAEQIKAYEAEGRKPHYRFRILEKEIRFQDNVRGTVHFEGKNLSDPIIIREDGSMTYLLTSVVDDVDFEITHIVRGEDHVTNTAIQIQMFELLTDKIPEFAHLALLKTQDAKISKREGGFDVMSLRDELHIEALAIECYLLKIGTSQAIEPVHSFKQLMDEFDLSHFGKNPANYDLTELARLNHKIVSNYSFDDVKDRLTHIDENIDKNFWDNIKPNLNHFAEINDWWDILENYQLENFNDTDFLEAAHQTLPLEPWTEESFLAWTNALKDKTGKKGKDLFMPLRQVMTGKDSGPELKKIMLLLGKEKLETRLASS